MSVLYRYEFLLLYLSVCFHKATSENVTNSSNSQLLEIYESGYDVFDQSMNRSFTISQEKKLTQDLLHRLTMAGKEGRPVVNMSMATSVEFGLGLIQMDLDEREKILTTSMWSKIKWNDVYLTWDPGDYGGVTNVRLETSQVWIPDIMLFNTADPENARRNAHVQVFYTGQMHWVPHQIFKSSCSIDVANFPFDSQTCNLWFGSWTHTLKDIDLNLAFPKGIDLSTFQSDYKDSCEWEIVSPQAERMLLPDDDPDPVAVLTFTLTLERKLVFSSYILTLPCVFLASLTMVVFWLPADRPDRTGLAMSLFSSFLVLLLILVEAAPPTASSVPILGVYYCFNMVIIMCSIFLSSIIINIYRAGDNNKAVPRWVHVIVVVGIGSVLCFRKLKFSKRSANHTDQYRAVNTYQNSKRNSTLNNAYCSTFQYSKRPREEENDLHNITSQGQETMDETNLTQAFDRQWKRLDRLFVDLVKALDKLVHKNDDKETTSSARKQIVSEWREVAIILDRFFCIVYLLLIIMSLLFLFPRPPGIKL